MGPARVVLAVVTILICGLFVPVAMAASDCMVMCEGPCGAPADVVTAPLAPPVIAVVTAAYTEAAPSIPTADPAVVEPPPK